MQLTNPSEIKRIMDKHGLVFKKKFGQNFLINAAVPERIAQAGAGEYTLEIGPGIGTLTKELAQRSKKVVAVEIDSGLIPVLSETLGSCANVKVIEDDILKVDLAALVRREFPEGRVSVCANLPYYITTPVLMHLLESGVPFASITVLVQKEVADRICAPAGHSDYGAISAVVAYYGKAEKLFRVSAGSFVPAPKVDSTVMKLTLYDHPPVEVVSEQRLFRMIKGAFGQRRKTLVNALGASFSDIGKEKIGQIIQACGFDSQVRGEKLSIEDFACLERAFAKIN
ncbi:MAG: 16S rRNA (adenine(1518)-N(6)/adenine(1519)-N(6))-dimethyltransferase RsmA [Clostridiales bacterium]|nr:16S rRNA (adenine(1518)-N(6)/adenine(1519)-N(6))-dimethyltransferase RsmA [Clostridiales bacterium]